MFHWRSLALKTGKLPRSERPSAVTSSLASTVPSPGDQLTGASEAYASRYSTQDVGALDGAQRAPVTAVRGRALTALELRDQLGDRAGPVRLGVVPGVEDLQEDPLGPLVVVRLDRRERAALVVAQAQPAQLGLHVLHVGLGGDARVRTRLYGVLLGGQAEGVEAQGVQHVVPGHALVTGEDIGGDVAQRVTDVQARTGGVREHVHDELLRLGGQFRIVRQIAGRVRRLVRAVGVPEVLPACLDVGSHCRRIAVRRSRLGCGIRLAHDPQSSIDRHLPALTETKKPLAQEGTPRRFQPGIHTGRD